MNKIFRSYNRAKYIARIKHWRGRSVHSPFLYNVVRSAFMKNRNISINEELFNKLIEKNFRKERANKICRLFTHLKYESYTFDAHNYGNEDLVIINSKDVDIAAITRISEVASQSKKTICVVVNGIYDSRHTYKTWQLLGAITGGVAVDLFHDGYLFLDYYLNNQNFKMRF